MAVKTLEDKFEAAFTEEWEARASNDVKRADAAEWAQIGWDACLQLIREEGIETRMEDAMRELKVLSEIDPAVFRKVAERLESTL